MYQPSNSCRLAIGESGLRHKPQWALLATVALVSVLLALPTLTLTPTIWQDEVQIVDYGRVSMPSSDVSYSMTWMLGGYPKLILTYLGPAIQELSYRAFGGPQGPRMSSIAGATFASFALLGWLLARGSSPWIALVCAVAFLWDPLFVEGYRGGRVDGWAIGFMLSAMWLLWISKSEVSNQGIRATGGLERVPHPAWPFLAAGLCVGIAGLIWISAALLVPLLIHELFAATNRGTRRLLSRSAIVAFVSVGFAALASLILGLLPFASFVPGMLGGLSHSLAAGAGSGRGEIDLLGLLRPFTRSPWLLLAALAAMVFTRQWSIIFSFVAAVFGVLLTEAYVHRAIYLIPYFLLAIASSCSALWTQSPPRPGLRMAVSATLVIALTWSGAMTLVARNALALKQRVQRDPHELLKLATSEIGKGDYRVYMGTWQLYYAGRSLGWRQFRTPESNVISPSLLEHLGSMDFVVFREDDRKRPSDEVMSGLGFHSHVAETASSENNQEVSGRRVASGFTKYVIFSK
jgi:hypothetical protein